jgi:hypothetical protein
MNARSIFCIFLALCFLLVTAGCTQTKPTATPTPTAVETSATEAPTVLPTTLSLTPGPTQSLPENWNIEVQAQGNGEAINPLITVSCQGGKGLNFIQQIDVTVTRSDGVVEHDVILKPLFKGKEVSLPITSQMGKVNRVEIWATTPQGDKVKIFDDYVPFRTYN